MSILRFASRSMLASYFIVDGIKAISNPEPLVTDAEKVTDIALPIAQRVSPGNVGSYLPEEPKTWVRIIGASELVGGVGLAFGIARRPSAALLTLAMIPQVLISRPDRSLAHSERVANRSVFFSRLALLGGVGLAAQDTEGKPGISWRAEQARKALIKQRNERLVAKQRRKKLAEKAKGKVAKAKAAVTT
ncbi:MAG: DoxX family protein [Propionibacterium sp.]|nr:MAG: DoxX family protein [Propionibacterium sp.]